jgi:ketosteroid isomerase-like protein
MDDADAFLAAVMPALTAADTALHNGDAGPRTALWSRTDPVTLFGAARTVTGADDVIPFFEVLAGRFSNCTSFEYEVTAAGVSGDLAYGRGESPSVHPPGDNGLQAGGRRVEDRAPPR